MCPVEGITVFVRHPHAQAESHTHGHGSNSNLVTANYHIVHPDPTHERTTIHRSVSPADLLHG